jgi:hypothetical protein
MIVALFRKELRQHWPALLLIALLTMGGYGLIILGALLRGESGSVFESLRVFIIMIVVLASLVLCHRLVVVEYAAKTQLFLEALPVSRWRMVAAKYALGLTVMVGIVLLALAIACSLGARHEALTPRFVAILGVRAVSVAVCAYHFFFVMGFLGRYRLALYLVAFLAGMVVSEFTDLEPQHFGPFALLDEKFAFENQQVPWDALAATWALSTGCLAVAFLLALTREGGVAALLAEKMSHREKVFIAALLVGVLFAVTLLDEKKRRAPFDLHDAATARGPGVSAKVATGSDHNEEDAQALARHVADTLSSARDFLGLEELPPVFITRRRDLDSSRYERGELEEASGVHVQANFASPSFRRDEFTGWLLRETLIAHTDGRVKLEPKMWVLDGFALYNGTCENASDPLVKDKALALRALYGAEVGFAPQDLRRWYSFRERVGGDIATGVAWSGIKTLARRTSPERAQRFIRSVLGAEEPKDLRAMVHEWIAPTERLLLTEAGLQPEEFWTLWQEELAAARQELAMELAQLPRLSGQMDFSKLSLDSRQAHYRVEIEPPPLPGTRYSLAYCELPVFDEEVAPQLLRREQNPYPARAEGQLPDSFSRGGRIYWAFELEVPAMSCAVVSGWRREDIR